ncbi:uncharacterized protein CGFF_03818 [Nakaseomyces glabratus]|nr:Signal recognition particle 9 kDa protein (SRP9) [Nakaseomyces glabratus]QNG15895.1 uncharacterized protein GWK60_K11429 [Nakaseomyces glabratus]SCV16257.1 uncharacterized protein CGFF_03818 [Nakaseomyces glabratus]SLM16055.1 uncharacterized protein CGFF_03818 [Nakaseomyces glabratus]
MSVKPIDTFIENSVKLFEANPSGSSITISYHGGAKADPVVFRTHNPHLSTTYKYQTKMNKEVSRVLNALGPRGVSMNPISKIAKRRNYLDVVKKAKQMNNSKISKKQAKLIRKAQTNPIVNTIGIGKLIANEDIKEVKAESTSGGAGNKKTKQKKNKNNKDSTPVVNTSANAQSKGKNKKNKNKKKR